MAVINIFQGLGPRVEGSDKPDKTLNTPTNDDLVDVAAGQHGERALVQVHDGQVRAASLNPGNPRPTDDDLVDVAAGQHGERALVQMAVNTIFQGLRPRVKGSNKSKKNPKYTHR